MMSDKLNKAREYEKIYSEKILSEERPRFHVSPYVGWMNDPNGFSFFKDECHLFYQYYPYDTNWGPMHWGHLKSSDLIKWEYLPAALAPDSDFDKDGCWSGSAIELPDGRQALVYTGNIICKDKDGREYTRQSQCLAIGNGIDYEKYGENPVISESDLPEGAGNIDFRDPKVWFNKDDDQYYLVVGNRSDDESGMILLYKSSDLTSWKFVCILDRSNNEYGKMWECPDFFKLDGEDILVISPQEMRPKEPEYHGGNGNICIEGSFDSKICKFSRRNIQSIDQGLDFYAPQTTMTPDGRRVMIGWMQSWESCRNQPAGNKFFGMMTIPRELFIRNGRLCQKPITEIEKYRENGVFYNRLPITDEIGLEKVSGRFVDMIVDIKTNDTSTEDCFVIKLAADQENDSQIRFYPESGKLCFDRSNSGFNYDIVNKREIFTTKNNVNLRIILDRFSIEIFVNDGMYVLTNTIYTPISADKITFASSCEATINVEKWDIVV